MLDNSNLIIAENGGAITLASVLLTNESGAMFEAASGGSINWITGGIDNFGTFDADGGSITFGGSIGITNKASGIFEAANGGSITFGTSGIGSVTNTSGGLIEALSGGTITFDSTLNGAQNAGTIKADGGTVMIEAVHVQNDGGTIEAIDAGTVKLEGATINFGTIESSSNGVIEAVSGTNTLMNVTIDGGDVKIDPNAILDLSGGSDPNHALTIDGTVTFEGGGTVKLDFTTYKIVAGAGGGTLDNATTIEGAGQIGAGDGKLSLDNQSGGVVDADINGATLIIYTGNTVTNAGTLESSNSGTLDIKDNVDNTSLIEARFGSRVDFESASSVTNDGGTIKADISGEVAHQFVDYEPDERERRHHRSGRWRRRADRSPHRA